MVRRLLELQLDSVDRHHGRPEGSPPKGCTIHQSNDSTLGVWEYEPGEFQWRLDEAQSACILSGCARVELADGRTLKLEAGKSFYMPEGMHGHWVVERRLRAVSIATTPKN
jgi:uncharacterized cupin superfamily protein